MNFFIQDMDNHTASRSELTSNPNRQESANTVLNQSKAFANWHLALSPIPEIWALTPVKDKRPLRPDWQHEVPISRHLLLELLEKGQELKSSKGKIWHCHWTGVGLRLGTISGGLLAIDADGERAETKLQEMSNQDLPTTISWTSGKP
ncbi:MAG: bifunctional DNA primase/polymerase, partial [Snowella sp.]|nr:bifunctional DNA primase/polymerase [Snowella sp.]